MSSSWIAGGPKSNDKSLEENRRANGPREEVGAGGGKVEAEVGVGQLQAKECQGLLAAPEAKREAQNKSLP